MDRSDSLNRITFRERVGVFAVLGAMALAVLDAGEVNVALPLLSEEFGAAPAETIRVVTVYQLAVLIGLLPCAHAAEAIGHRRLFFAGIALFGVATVACASAPSLELLLAARFAQGLGASAIMALGIALLRHLLGHSRLGTVIAWNALTVALCSAAGPTIGATILDIAGWRWIFVAGLPIAALALSATPTLPASSPTRGKSDLWAITLYATAIVLLFAASQIAAAWTTLSVALAGLGIATMAALVRRDLPRRAPLIPIDLLAQAKTRTAVIASVLCFAGQSAGLVVLPFQLANALGQGTLQTGLVITCWPLSVALASALANRKLGGWSQPTLCVTGASILALGLFASSVVPAREAIMPLTGAVMLCGCGFGLFQLANNKTLFLTAPSHRAAAAGGVQGTARLTGQTAGTSITSLIFALVPIDVAPQACFVIAGLVALGAALISSISLFDPHAPKSGEARACNRDFTGAATGELS